MRITVCKKKKKTQWKYREKTLQKKRLVNLKT